MPDTPPALIPFLVKLVIIAPPMLAAVILHEIAHGVVAGWFGDDTARRAGRLTLNPIRHIDPVGSVLLPLLLVAVRSPFIFGWAKPVPVNFLKLRHPKSDMVAVAFAGPATNIVLALLSAVVAHVAAAAAAGQTNNPAAWITALAVVSVEVNVVLAIFNLVPILPLDGGRVLFGLLPQDAAMAFARLEPYGILIVMGLLFTGAFGFLLGPVAAFVIHALL